MTTDAVRDPRIFRRAPIYVLKPGGGRVPVIGPRWYARCPECHQKIQYKARKYEWEPLVRCTTPKEARDALYRHRKQEHGLGQVGRRARASTAPAGASPFTR